MSKLNFFTPIESLLQDKESIEIKVQKTGDELTVLLVPKMQGKTATITLNGTAEELEEGFLAELQKPIEKIRGLKSNAEEAKVEDLEESEEEENIPEGSEKGRDIAKEKKAAAKKEASKKPTAKEKLKKVVENRDTEINPEEKTTEQIKAENEQAKAEEDAKLKAEAEAKAAEEEAKKEAERIAKEIADLVSKGDAAFKACLFRDAKKHYQEAHQLKQDDEAIAEKLAKANKWVDQLISDGVIKEEEEAANGIEG